MIGTQKTIGVGPPGSALLFVIASPVGPYYPTGFKAVSLEATDYAVRAWPGGVGDKKLGANYAPCIVPQQEAASRGFQQNLWLFGEEEYVTEVGTMNLFMAIKNKETGQKELLFSDLLASDWCPRAGLCQNVKCAWQSSLRRRLKDGCWKSSDLVRQLLLVQSARSATRVNWWTVDCRRMRKPVRLRFA